MIEQFISSLKLINLQVFLFSALVFMVGYALAPTVHYKNIKWLTAYPLWMEKVLEKLLGKKWNSILMFLFIFILNLLSLFIDLLSGLVLFVPLIMALWMGLNIGIITYNMLNGRFFYSALFNPVSMFELPAAFIALSLAFQLNLASLGSTLIPIEKISFSLYFNAFLSLVVPLLALSGIIETFALHISKKFDDKDLDL
jgi:hypothetical protein